jgi:cysteine desulfurase
MKVRSQAHTEAKRLSAIREDLIHILEANATSIVVNGPKGNRRLANNLHITVPGYDNERLLMELDERGFQVATGSACSASNDEPSHVLKALGLTDERAQSSIRITMGRYTTKESAHELIDAIISIIS